MAFKKGQSGNPRGRPKGTLDKRVALRDMLTPHAEELIKVCVDLAKMGDGAALKICMDRLVAPVREDAINVTIPKIESADDCTLAQANVLNAVAAGQMLPSEGQVLSGLINAQRLAYETSHLAAKVANIQTVLDKLTSKGTSS